MSWWDSQNFSDFASNALRNAQKKIDKVLDIQDENTKQKDLRSSKKEIEDSSWSTWLPFDHEKLTSPRSSWSLPFGLKSEPENDSFFTQQPSTPVTQQAPKQTNLPPIYPSRNNSAKDLLNQTEETSEKIKGETSQCTTLEPETESHKDKTEAVQATLDPSRKNKTKKNEKHSLFDPVENKSDSPKEDSFIDISSIESNISFESEKSNFVEHESITESNSTMGKAVPDFEEISSSNTVSSTEILKSSTEANISFEELESEVKIDNERESTPAYESSLLAVCVNTDSDNGESPLQMKGSDFEPAESRDNNKPSHQSFNSDQENVGLSDLDLQNYKPVEIGKQTLESANDSLQEDENAEISIVNEDLKTVSGTDALPCDNSNLMDVTCESLNSFHTVIRSQTTSNKTDKSDVVEVVESCDITEFTQSASQAQVEPSSSLVSESVEDHYDKTLSSEGKLLKDNKKIFKGVCETPINNKQQELEEYSPLSPIVEVIEESSNKVDCYESKIDSSANTSSCSSETVIEKVSTLIETEGKQELEAASTESIMSSSSNSSYVKCLIEEAMEEARSEHSDSHSNSADRSESSKTESEHNSEKSVSGHDSGDEIDTTTSSDIEIISTPTPNGERSERLFDLSPLRITLHKSLPQRSPVHAHQRSDSQSSSSTYSKCGESDQLSPGRDSLERQDLESGDESKEGATPSVKEEPNNDKDSPDVPLDVKDACHPDKLLKAELNPRQTVEFCKKLAELSEVLQHRENKLVQMSRENNDLLETNSILRNQLQQSEEIRETEQADIHILTEEFTERLAESEKKIQTVLREKESLKKQLQKTIEENTQNKSLDSSYKEILDEKDNQIAELLHEGEKLSKQQLQSNNIIKKLRTKEKENDSLIASQKKKLEELKTESDDLKAVLDSNEDTGKKQSETISKLNTALVKQEKEVTKLKNDLDESQEKVRGLQVALDNSYKEIAELNKTNAARDSKVQEAVLSAELQVREEFNYSMEKDRQKARLEKESFICQIEDLQINLSRQEKEHTRREDLLKREISDLQQRLQEDEARNQDLTISVTSATRPLLRQIENLQSTYGAQSLLWEKREKALTERISEIQQQLAVAEEKENISSEKILTLSSKIKALETQNTSMRQEKCQLSAQLEMEKSKREMLEDSQNNATCQLAALRQQMSNEVMELKKDKVYLEAQLEIEKTKVDNEKKKLIQSLEQLKEMEKNFYSRGSPSPISSNRTSPNNPIEATSMSMTNSLSASGLSQDDLDKSLLFVSTSASGSKSSLYEHLRQGGGGAANLLENLQSQLKQKEGEITQLQDDISQLERTRESMARELVNLSNLNDNLQEQVTELPEIKEKHSELYQRYNALLQMYGEKVEEAEELRMDLQDIKKMYKDQIDHLLAK
ncbi:TATA element modulatory factor isoform X1 [Octopus bimaculoides]|uniref:TATA element modulatory factor 1 TATA binding domain-containing protein n=1 Tax=Octopus bimaculoides TaxID=37653 RepID=A0A0L8HAT1_OCTBM|nr:TATA element modulatory factor isoform X1 [Octopus bimaculoides]XP_014774012.1 TATA element modulatory factor isoform X1 [Octopus bimaculoides]XP_052823027.1 TATA element modulatory factor isoform X1 [Octopus bimaculoides]|eukprot:XP_014774011.1 PREDICTED: TATA element modulatory factor-like isoform X1 [Octopus bimaculoides]